MARLTIKAHVDAAPEVVFAVASDFEHAAENFQGIEQFEILTEGPIGVGTRFRETRVMFGKQNTEELEITAFDEPRGYVVECDSCGAHYRSEYKFVADIAGTHVRLELDCRPVSLLARLMAPLSALMMGSVKKCLTADLEDLKQAAEAREREIARST
ncbi:MAG: SRPBCC family protein [Planctomycetales bacterium]|nr:SRPBCC family protein [Planctomycetales bacterium]